MSCKNLCTVGVSYVTSLLALFCTELFLEGLLGEVVGGMLDVAGKSAVARSEVSFGKTRAWKNRWHE
jgi:hypothetical protein